LTLEDQKIDELKAMFNQWKKEEKEEQQVGFNYYLFLCLHKRPVKADNVWSLHALQAYGALFSNCPGYKLVNRSSVLEVDEGTAQVDYKSTCCFKSISRKL